MSQQFTRTIRREKTFKSVSRTLDSRTWVFEIGPRGISVWPKGHPDWSRSLDWYGLVAQALIHGKGNGGTR